MTDTTATPSTALAPIDRARLALNITEERLAELRAIAAKSAGIVKITNPDGYKECHAARMALKNLRLEIERAGETARADAQAYAKAVIAGQKQLLAEIEPEEQRLKAIQDAEDARAEEVKRKAREAESARIAGINQRLEWIRNRALENVGATQEKIAAEIADLEAMPITDELYGEFSDQAGAALALVLDKLRTMHAQAREHAEREAALNAQREELARKQAELDAADRERAERIKREDAERKFAAEWDEAIREDAQRAEDAKRAYAQAWEDAIAYDVQRTAALADAAAREQRERERRALEGDADPWTALETIRTIHADPFPAASEKLDQIGSVVHFVFVARDKLAKLA